MKIRLKWPLVLTSLCLLQVSGTIFTNAGAEIIPADRKVDWSANSVGVPGGIPNRTTIFTTLAAGATTAQIQAAINSCPSNQVVLLGPGNFTITSKLSFSFRSGITLRGSGTNTVLINQANGSVISLGNNTIWNTSLKPPFWSAGTPITGGSQKGSTTISVSSTAGLSPGMMVMIDQNNDTSLAFDANNSRPRAMGQTTIIQSISGNDLTVWPALLFTFNPGLDARVKNLGGPANQINFSGVEDLVIQGGGAATGINIEQAYGCWLKNVITKLIPNYHVMLMNSVRCSIVGSSFLDTPDHGPNHYGVGLQGYACSSLIENCIFYRIFPGIEINMASSGNVIGYNLIHDVYQDGFGQGCGLDMNHGPHNVMNLAEGNHVNMIQSDGYFGSDSHGTLFRNRVTGWTPTYPTQNSKAISLNRWARYYNIVGNVLGTAGVSSLYEWTNSPGPCVYQFGFPNMGNGSYTGTTPPIVYNNPGSGPGDNQSRDLLVKSTAIIHGNHDVITGGIVWDPSNSDRTIPDSLYLPGKPNWFGDRPWPPFSAANPSAATMTNFPAGYRFVFGGVATNQPGNQPPIAASSATPVSGKAPLTVTFSSTGSSDPEGDPLSYNWTFGDGTTSTSANPSHTYQTVSNFVAQLRVSDGTNFAYASPIVITATAPGSGLVAAYGFEDGSGGTAVDTSGNTNVAAVGTATWAPGKFGTALSFNGTNSIVMVNDSSSLRLASAMTLEAWVYPKEFNGNWQSLIFKPGNPSMSTVSYVMHGGSQASSVPSTAVSGSPNNLFGNSVLPLNTWSHIAATYNGSTLRLFVNGVQVASAPQSGTLTPSSEPLRIGMGWRGLIDEVRIYNRDLDASEIISDMNAAVKTVNTPQPPTNLRIVE